MHVSTVYILCECHFIFGFRSADYNSDYPPSRLKSSASEKAVNHVCSVYYQIIDSISFYIGHINQQHAK